MNKKELIKAISGKTGFTQKDVETVVSSMVDVIAESVKNGDDVNIVGFGKFVAKKVEASVKRNPKTGESVSVAPHMAIKFRPSTILKENIN